MKLVYWKEFNKHRLDIGQSQFWFECRMITAQQWKTIYNFANLRPLNLKQKSIAYVLVYASNFTSLLTKFKKGFFC